MTDFVKFPHFPAFNVADMAITFGVVALIYVLEGRRGRRPMPRELTVPAAAAASGSTCSSPRTPARARRRSG